jgi:sestrin
MYGVFHDDYPYDQLNRILPLMHKVFLKKMACFPERINKADYWRMRNYELLSPEDIVHYGHIVFETRRITELTFAMRALAKVQASSISYS